MRPSLRDNWVSVQIPASFGQRAFPLGVQSRSEVGWIVPEPVRVVSPGSADVFVGSETAKGLKALGEVVRVQEGGEVISKLPVCDVMISPHGGFLEGSVHALDLAVGPRVIGLGEAVFDVMLPADAVKGMQPVSRRRSRPMLWHIAELHAIVGQNGVNSVRHRSDQGFEKGRGGPDVGCLV